MKNKSIKILFSIILLISISSCSKKEAFCRKFIENIKSKNKTDVKVYDVDKICIGKGELRQVIYFTSADSCGNDEDGFDLCLLYFPDGSLYYEDTKHYCGYEGTYSLLGQFDRTSIESFLSDAKKFGFKLKKNKF